VLCNASECNGRLKPLLSTIRHSLIVHKGLPHHDTDVIQQGMKPWYVKDTQFAQRISEQDMSIFQRVCPDRRYTRGETIFRAGDLATDLHVLAQGQVKLVTLSANGSERILAILGPSDFFGEAFLGDAAYYSVDAVALSDVMTCPVSRAQFLQMSLQAPQFVLTFTQILASHLFDCREQLSASYAPVKFRVIRVLLEQAERFGTHEASGWTTFKTVLKHEELAAMVSATRVSVSMAIAELRDAGLLEGTRGNYRIHSEALVKRLEL
jgi:CRP/FNR family cyclic AMP-dependent transcriptional regulator